MKRGPIRPYRHRRARPHHRDPAPRRAGEVLTKWVRRQKLDRDLDRWEIVDRWDELIGPRIAARTAPRALRHGRLTVVVASSAWLTELHFLLDGMVERINGGLGREVVEELRLVAGDVRRPRLARRASRPEPPPDAPVAPERWRALQQKADTEVAVVRDPTLRRAIRGARLSHLRRQEAATSEPHDDGPPDPE